VRGAIKGVRALIDRGYDVHVVSDRPDSLYDATRSWLNRRGLSGLPLIFTNRQHPRKLDIIRQERLSLVVEDAPHHAESMAQDPAIRKVYLLHTPYNAHVNHPKVHRVRNWSHLLDVFDT
jgi:uncharacterized HAD superfamily protein